MTKLERINAFIHVVEANGFAAAARKQGISTPAISRQITALEASLGVQLLKRTTRQVALTDIGLQYYQHCKNALTLLSDAEDAIANSRRDATGVLSILSNRHFAFAHLLPRLADFMQMNPKLHIQLQLAERFPDLSQENIDIVYGVSQEGPPDLVRRRIASTKYVLCASPSYLKQHGIPRTPADLVQHAYITHSMRKPLDVLIFADGRETYLEPALWLNDTQAMHECALQGMGVVKLHEYEVAESIKENCLTVILPDYPMPQISVYLYYRQSRYLQAKIRRFIDFYME
ncbi:LysR family transcriptional regulator [Aquicella siphonis]|nr:LysR family transcriptional regulator [Aquicella siphonis]